MLLIEIIKETVPSLGWISPSGEVFEGDDHWSTAKQFLPADVFEFDDNFDGDESDKWEVMYRAAKQLGYVDFLVDTDFKILIRAAWDRLSTKQHKAFMNMARKWGLEIKDRQ